MIAKSRTQRARPFKVPRNCAALGINVMQRSLAHEPRPAAGYKAALNVVKRTKLHTAPNEPTEQPSVLSDAEATLDGYQSSNVSWRTMA